MFRVILGVVNNSSKWTSGCSGLLHNIRQVHRNNFLLDSARHLCMGTSTLPPTQQLSTLNTSLLSSLTGASAAHLKSTNFTQLRFLTKYSLQKGKRKSLRKVVTRFFRLDWGAWIRTKCGRNKRLWKKSAARKFRIQQHVFCNATQSRMLDAMVGKYWRKPRQYIDDPYAPYHSREEFIYSSFKPKL